MVRRQIFGVGGKFFVEPWEEPLLQRHLLGLPDKPEPKVCFLGTATGDNPVDIEQFYRELGQQRARLSHLNLFAPHTADFAGFLGDHDIIYVGGGATRNLMALWRDWGMDVALRQVWEGGVVLSGTSAGSICWFEGCITDSLPKTLLPLDCVGLIKGSGCTHYDARPDRPPRFRALIAEGQIPAPGLATEDHVGIHFVDDALFDVVTAKPGQRAWRLELEDGRLVETPITARYLGDPRP